MTATGNTKTCHDDSNGRKNGDKGQNGDGRHDDGDAWHNDGDGPFYHHINASPTPTADETLGIIVDGKLFAGSDRWDLVFTSSA